MNHNRHYKVRPKDAAIEAAMIRLRRADQAILNEPHADGEGLADLLAEQTAARAQYADSHAQPDTFVCHYARCDKEFDHSELVLIPFLRVIVQGEFKLDDGREKYITLCRKCFNRLGLINL
jgi:hypothetical protein